MKFIRYISFFIGFCFIFNCHNFCNAGSKEKIGPSTYTFNSIYKEYPTVNLESSTFTQGMVYPDYNNCLVNVSNSILKNFGIATVHNTLPELDEYLKKDYKNVVLILHDGFGSNLIKKALDEKSFLYKNKVKDITSVFPTVTINNTTSLYTGMYPEEHGWISRKNYIKSTDKIIDMFKSCDISKKEFPYDTIFQKINSSNKGKGYCIITSDSITPFHESIHYDSNKTHEMYDKIIELCKNDGKKFIYAYCKELKNMLCESGTNNAKATQTIKTLNKKTEQLCIDVKDTLVIITADHGLIDISRNIFLEDYPVLKNMLTGDFSMDSRAANFFVKPEMLESFKEEFNKLFGKDFVLLTKQEVFDKKLLGTGKSYEKIDSCIGDYLAIGLTSKRFVNSTEILKKKAHYAGLNEDEVSIPLIIIDKK